MAHKHVGRERYLAAPADDDEQLRMKPQPVPLENPTALQVGRSWNELDLRAS